MANMILVIDNFDSFTYNVVQCLREMGCDVVVKRNNKISIEQIQNMAPTHIVISPGPGSPNSAGISLEVVDKLRGQIPILALCLGHQCIGQSFGGEIVRAKQMYHGRTSAIEHDGEGVFRGLKSPIKQTRYHSLVIDEATMPTDLKISARSEDGEIMGVRHKLLPIEGVQFHPESIGSEHGATILRNFVFPDKAPELIDGLLEKISNKQSLSLSEAERIMTAIASGNLSEGKTAAFLTALSMKGEDVAEIAGFAGVIRAYSRFVQAPANKIIVDNCGTGGDSSATFNISTVAAIVSAGAGVTIAKHGNRSVTSKCGSADLLEALGVKLNVPKAKIENTLASVGIAFLFAPDYHPVLKKIKSVRSELGFRTIFNIVGPLANPANANRQMIGVFAEHLTQKVAEVMKIFGTKHGLVVHGEDGLDEITLTSATRISELKNGKISNYSVTPEQFDLKRCEPQDLIGGTADDNKTICLDILAGQLGPKTDVVLLNAAATIYVAGLSNSIVDGIELARQSIESGNAMAKLDQLINATR